jgi:hypothetical protein
MVDVETPSVTPNATPSVTPLLGPSIHPSSSRYSGGGRMSPLSRLSEMEERSESETTVGSQSSLGETKTESGNYRIGRSPPPLFRSSTDDFDTRMHTSDSQSLSTSVRNFRVDSRDENRPRSNTADSYDHMESGDHGSALERRTMIASSIHGIDLDALGLSVGRSVLFFFFWFFLQW